MIGRESPDSRAETARDRASTRNRRRSARIRRLWHSEPPDRTTIEGVPVRTVRTLETTSTLYVQLERDLEA